MKCQGWAIPLICLFIAALGSGCACVDSCCTDTCDFGGCGCTQLCGSQTQPVVDTLGQMSLDWQAKVGGCAAQCGGSCGGCTSASCTRPRALSCANWGRREHFIDGAGRPCYGPIATVAMTLRNSLMSCGCGQMYVDEWISDPPLCQDPCGTGCSALGECGPYVGAGGGCGCGAVAGGGGCSGGGCTSCTAPAAEPAYVEPSCGCSETACTSCTGGSVEPSCGCASCGACGISGIGCGQVAKGVVNKTASTIGCKVEHFLADRKFKWSQRGRTRTCGSGTCKEYGGDIADYRFDNPETVRAQSHSQQAGSCDCASCKTRATTAKVAKEPVAHATKPSRQPYRQVQHTCDCEKCGGQVRGASYSR